MAAAGYGAVAVVAKVVRVTDAENVALFSEFILKSKIGRIISAVTRANPNRLNEHQVKVNIKLCAAAGKFQQACGHYHYFITKPYFIINGEVIIVIEKNLRLFVDVIIYQVRYRKTCA